MTGTIRKIVPTLRWPSTDLAEIEFNRRPSEWIDFLIEPARSGDRCGQRVTIEEVWFVHKGWSRVEYRRK
jgi:hypothetical protein